MTDPIATLSEAQGLVRKVDHSLKSEVSRRLCCDVESLLQTIMMIEVLDKKETEEQVQRRD